MHSCATQSPWLCNARIVHGTSFQIRIRMHSRDGYNWGGGGTPPHIVAKRHDSRQKNSLEPFGRHNVFGTSDFPLWPCVYIVTCHDSLPPPLPHPRPPSGAKTRSIPDAQAHGKEVRKRYLKYRRCRNSTGHWTGRLLSGCPDIRSYRSACTCPRTRNPCTLRSLSRFDWGCHNLQQHADDGCEGEIGGPAPWSQPSQCNPLESLWCRSLHLWVLTCHSTRQTTHTKLLGQIDHFLPSAVQF